MAPINPSLADEIERLRVLLAGVAIDLIAYAGPVPQLAAVRISDWITRELGRRGPAEFPPHSPHRRAA